MRHAILVAAAVGTAAASAYYLQDLTVSHYDAKAHLVVARRVLDSMRPGWIQIGAVWLPLPHLLNLIPVQSDWLYQTGLSAVVFSVAGFVLGSVSLWWLVNRATGSPAAAWAAFAVFAAHPDVLYLQATPMTESLLMGLCLLGIAQTWTWVAAGATGSPWRGGWPLALACLTRYEAWGVTAAALAAAILALWSRGVPARRALWRVAALAAYPVAAVLAFLVLSRATIGEWLVTGGFYEVDHSTLHRPMAALHRVADGVRLLNGDVTATLGALSAAFVLISVVQKRRSAHLLVVLALVFAAALPFYAFWSGHPFRMRYMVPMTMGLAAVIGLAVGLLPRARTWAATAVIVLALIETPPFSSGSPVVVEAQRDRLDVVGRAAVTECLVGRYDQTPILASMGSLAPYMHETSRAGFSLKQYVHEGIGQLWSDSLLSARSHVGWVLLEEQAEGGDVLTRHRTAFPEFLEGFERVCTGGGVSLYQRTTSVN